MDVMKVGICLNDMHFAHALSIGLARVCRNMTFTVLRDMENDEDYDLLLLNKSSDCPNGIELVKDEAKVNIFGDPPFRVYRYKESQHLVNDLLFIYYRLSGKNLEVVGDSACKIIAFTSVSGGCGCTLTALTVGQMLNKLYGCKCLYLNLCPVDDAERYFRSDGKESLLQLLYYLEVEREFPLGTFITQMELIDCLHGTIMNSYFDEMSMRLLQRLLKKIDELGQYAFLLVDMSNHFSRNNKQLLAQAYRTVLLYKPSDKVPQIYFDRLVDELKSIAGTSTVIMAQSSRENYTADENALWDELTANEPVVTEEGVIDLNNCSYMRDEAVELAKHIIEGSCYD